MPGNNTGKAVKSLWKQYPGRLGAMLSVRVGGGDGWSNVAAKAVPYSIDNGRFIACTRQRTWDRGQFMALLDKAAAADKPPEFVTVPDVVGSATQTLKEWEVWLNDDQFMAYGFPLAFVAQDGMQPDDVPVAAEWIFIGGTPTWKKRNLWQFCRRFSRVHVGGINTAAGLWHCHNSGAASCDGTGWLREPKRMIGLRQYLYRVALDLGPRQMELFHLWEAESIGGRVVAPDMAADEAARVNVHVKSILRGRQ
jgi:hypothetical protein